MNRMCFRRGLIMSFGLAMSVALVYVAIAGNPKLPQDKGPATLDVSKYPKEIQKDYELFAKKCTKCHTLARPLNTSMTKDEWKRYVKRMMHKPNSGINSKQGKHIYEFLVYDQVNRKDKDPKSFYKALTDQELQKLQETQGKEQDEGKNEAPSDTTKVEGKDSRGK
jgi:hypothetical protein